MLSTVTKLYSIVELYYLYCYATRPYGRGKISVAFIRPSVRPSRTAHNSRIQRLSVPKFGRKVPHHRCDSHTSFKVKRSKVRVTRPINADTHIVRHISQMARPTNYELGTWMENDHPHQPQTPWPPRSKVKIAGHVINLSRVIPMAHKSKTVRHTVWCRLEDTSTRKPAICVSFLDVPDLGSRVPKCQGPDDEYP